jgi:thioredoxin 1
MRQSQPTVTDLRFGTDWKDALAKHEFVIVDCFAQWCGPCKKIAPKLEQLSGKFPEIAFFKLDVDLFADFATLYDVRALPTFLFFEKGKEKPALRVVGADVAMVTTRLEELLVNSSS